MANEALTPAKGCLLAGQYRSAVSRAYYSAFANVTGALVDRGHRPRTAEGTWAHSDLPTVAMHGLAKWLEGDSSRQLARSLRQCYRRRLIADYSPRIRVSKIDAVATVVLVQRLTKTLELGVWSR